VRVADAVRGGVGKRVRNVAALMEDGEIKFVQQKMLLPFYDVFDEQRYFEPAKMQALTVVKGKASRLRSARMRGTTRCSGLGRCMPSIQLTS
jgi:predicted amidohydrolase